MSMNGLEYSVRIGGTLRMNYDCFQCVATFCKICEHRTIRRESSQIVMDVFKFCFFSYVKQILLIFILLSLLKNQICF